MNPKDLTIDEQRAIDKARTPGVWHRDGKTFNFVNENGDGGIWSTGYDAFECSEADEAFIECASANYGVNLDIIVAQQGSLSVLHRRNDELETRLALSSCAIEVLERKIAELEHYIEGLEHPAQD